MKTILLKCEECNKDIQRKLSEYTRSKKIGRKTFCCVSCATTYSNRNRINNGEIISFPKQFIGKGRQLTKFSIYKPLMKFIKNRKNDKEIALTIDDLEEMWKRQNGLCVYTKIKLKLPTWNGKKEINTASVDRIDPLKSYTKENCQIISIMANYAKNNFSDEHMKEFCRLIAINYTT